MRRRCMSESIEVTELQLMKGQPPAPNTSPSAAFASGRFANLLRSSLRLSAPNKKSTRTLEVAQQASTAPVSPRHGSAETTGCRTSAPRKDSSPSVAAIASPRTFARRSASMASTSSYGRPVCRICHDPNSTPRATDDIGDSDVGDRPLGRLIAPCLCDGSLKYVHETCIQQWIAISHSKRCELCRFEYHLKSYSKPLREWTCCPLKSTELRRVLCFLLIYVVMQACVIWALYAIIGHILENPKSRERNWQFWVKILVIMVGIVSVLIFTYVQVRYLFDLIQRWYAQNKISVVQEPSVEALAKIRVEQRSSIPKNEFSAAAGAAAGGGANTVTAMP
ncbi:unnamed protein product [Mesocestoides corti]|uniref:RING-CH-type domain-containing protein n=1 Tax=Mesocestoides corti TaxID=53468 RepID=A0A0R3U1X6_MESCO|nr:unnamed protein product [Mesocestoides corti]